MSKKFFIWFLVIITVVVVGAFFWDSLSLRLRQKRVERLAEELKKIEQEDYERAMADTYGGKTPQETLQMYIDAVEKGDYELASKYFVLSGQETEMQNLSNIAKENITTLVSLLKQSLETSGSYSEDGSSYAIRRPILVRFVLYPNGIWKILEI